MKKSTCNAECNVTLHDLSKVSSNLGSSDHVPVSCSTVTCYQECSTEAESRSTVTRSTPATAVQCSTEDASRTAAESVTRPSTETVTCTWSTTAEHDTRYKVDKPICYTLQAQHVSGDPGNACISGVSAPRKYIFDTVRQHRKIVNAGSQHDAPSCIDKYYCRYRVLGNRHTPWEHDIYDDDNYVTPTGTYNQVQSGHFHGRLIPVNDCVKWLVVSEIKCNMSLGNNWIEEGDNSDDNWITNSRRCGIKSLKAGISTICICDRVYRSHHMLINTYTDRGSGYVSFVKDFGLRKVLLIMLTATKVPKLSTLAQIQLIKLHLTEPERLDLRGTENLATPIGSVRDLIELSPWQKRLLHFNTTGEVAENNFACQIILGAAGGHADFLHTDSSAELLEDDDFLQQLCRKMSEMRVDWAVESEQSRRLFCRPVDRQQTQDYRCQTCVVRETKRLIAQINRNVEVWTRYCRVKKTT